MKEHEMKNISLYGRCGIMLIVLFSSIINSQESPLLDPDLTNSLIRTHEAMRFDSLHYYLKEYRHKKIVLIPRNSATRTITIYLNNTENPIIPQTPLPIALNLPAEDTTLRCEYGSNISKEINTDSISNKTGLFILWNDSSKYYDLDSIMIKLQKDTIEHLDTIKDSLGNRIDSLDSCVINVTKQNQRLLKESRSELKYSLWVTGGAALFSFTGAAMENWYYLNRIKDQYRDAQNTTDALNFHLEYVRHQTLRNAALGVGTVSAILCAIQYYKLKTGTNNHIQGCMSQAMNNFDLMISYSPDDNGTSIYFTGAIPAVF
jgi:hypothetical protein